MCIRTIAHWLPCCHQRCTSIELCSDAISTLSNKALTETEKTLTKETTSEEATENEKNNTLNPFDCPAGGPVSSDRASEEVCPVCKEVEVGAGIDNDGHREREEAEVLAALGWESYFDRYG
jgi:hypothetical protein